MSVIYRERTAYIYIYTRDPNTVITLPAAAPEPGSAKPSPENVLTEKLYIYSFEISSAINDLKSVFGKQIVKSHGTFSLLREPFIINNNNNNNAAITNIIICNNDIILYIVVLSLICLF